MDITDGNRIIGPLQFQYKEGDHLHLFISYFLENTRVEQENTSKKYYQMEKLAEIAIAGYATPCACKIGEELQEIYDEIKGKCGPYC